MFHLPRHIELALINLGNSMMQWGISSPRPKRSSGAPYHPLVVKEEDLGNNHMASVVIESPHQLFEQLRLKLRVVVHEQYQRAAVRKGSPNAAIGTLGPSQVLRIAEHADARILVSGDLLQGLVGGAIVGQVKNELSIGLLEQAVQESPDRSCRIESHGNDSDRVWRHHPTLSQAAWPPSLSRIVSPLQFALCRRIHPPAHSTEFLLSSIFIIPRYSSTARITPRWLSQDDWKHPSRRHPVNRMLVSCKSTLARDERCGNQAAISWTVWS